MTTAPPTHSRPRPNVVLVLADDMGFSDIGCYGGEISTPTLDRLGRDGVRMSAFYNTARCSPSRASLLTGRDPHETGVGILTEDDRSVGGYPGTLAPEWPTMAEHLKAAGYRTCLSGKWHLSSDTAEPNDSWPTRRGFDEFYGILMGSDHYFEPVGLYHNEEKLDSPDGDYYLTDAVSEHAVGWLEEQDENPFFLYLAYTAPHWPLHAREEEITPNQETYDRGWDVLREERLARLRDEKILDSTALLSARESSAPAWDEASDRDWEARRMATYAAMVSAMDRGVGRVVETLERSGRLEDTLILFLSDNGGCAETLPRGGRPLFRSRQRTMTRDGRPVEIGSTPDIRPGGTATYTTYGAAWANLSNTPFRLYKRWVHEGGIATPLIAHWPAGGLDDGSVVREPHQLTDVLPTVLEAAGVAAPEGRGHSLLAPWRGDQGAGHPLFWEHIGNCAVRAGDWKLVREAGGDWELYDLSVDRSELTDLAGDHPDLVTELATSWQEWADAAGVLPWPAPMKATGADARAMA